MRDLGKLAAAGVVALALAGCAGPTLDYSRMPREHGRSFVQKDTHRPMQCAPYAREHSQVKIFGDAYTWWDQAAGRYMRSAAPQPGAVMVLSDYAGPTRGHLAVVRDVLSSREIRVDHANWLDDGAIYVNDPVMDVSEDNDWSAVRVYNIKTGGWGTNVYPVKGFIGPAPSADRVADAAGPASGPGDTAGAIRLAGEIN
ncbi:MAG TPA: CHAP domain-containing protein [Rhizomicrobium sp.]|nr:CHAP domain-containing protein [Rhizomicrobium sp.]